MLEEVPTEELQAGGGTENRREEGRTRRQGDTWDDQGLRVLSSATTSMTATGRALPA